MRSRLVSVLCVVGVAAALVTVPAMAASAAVPGQDFEGFTTGLVDGQGGWTVSNHAFDYAIADTTGLYGGVLGTRALRVSNAVTSGSFGDQLFSEQLANEAGEPSAENGGLSGGVRQSRYSASFRFASADPSAEQPGLMIGVSPDRGDGARMSLVRLYDTPTGLKVTAFGYDGGDGAGFVETTVASDLDRSIPHTLAITMDFVDGASNDRVAVSVDGTPPVEIGSWEQYFREVEHNPSRTVDSLLFRASVPAPDPSKLLGKGFFIDSVVQSSSASPVVTTRTITPAALVSHAGGWQAFPEPDWTSTASSRFVDGPSGTTGPGSIKMSLGPVVGANNGKYYLGRSLLGVPVGNITGFRYRVLTATTNNGVMQPYVNLTVAGGGTSYANLVYDPNDPQSNPNPLPGSNGVWRTFDAFSPASKWRNSRPIAGTPAWTYHSLAEWLQIAPDLTTHPTVGGIYVIAGASLVNPAWTDYLAYLDGFDLTVAGTETADSFDLGSPLSPGSLVASNLQPRSAAVTWVADAGTAFAPVDGYEVVVDGTPQNVGPDVTTLPLTSLSAGSTHRVSIRAVRGGQTGPAVATTFQTPTIPVPAVVSGLVANGITTASAGLTWASDPTVGDAAVDGYEVALTPVGGTVVLPSTAHAWSLSALTPGATYTATLRAHNVSGWSNPVSVTFTTNDLDRRTPGAPTLAVGTPDPQGSLPLAWNANAGDSPDFPVQHWIVTVDGADEAYLPSTTLTYSVPSLAIGRHTVAVRGANAIGSVAFASQVVVIEAAAPPASAPPSIRLAAAPATITFGARTALKGTVVSGTAPVVNAAVTIELATGSTWSAVTSTTTATDGSFSVPVAPTTTTRYRATAAGAAPVVVTVTVRPKITDKVAYATAKGGTKVALVTAVTPRLAGATMRLQKLTGTTWRTVASAKLGARSTATITVGTFGSYAARYRLLLPATSTTPQSVSVSILVRTPKK